MAVKESKEKEIQKREAEEKVTEKKEVKRKGVRIDIIIGIVGIFFVTLVIWLLNFVALGFNMHRDHLRTEADSVIHEVMSFKQWFLTTPNAKNHFAATEELSRIHAKAAGSSSDAKVASGGAAEETLERQKQTSFTIVSYSFSKPDSFQENALNTFRDDAAKKYVDAYEAGTFRYAKPIRFTDACLRCHSKSKAGEVDAIINVNIAEAGVFPHFPFTGLTYILGAFGIAALLFNMVWFRGRIMKPLRVIDTAFTDIREGKYDVRIHLNRSDEFGDLGDTINTTMDKLTTLIQTDEERRQMQENIVKFLDILSSASEGDFTNRAEVTPDIFGSLGDAYNLMLEGLSELIDKVRNSADGVNSESMRMLNVLKALEGGAGNQMMRVENSTQSVNEAANSAIAITDKTLKAQEISRNALTAISNGSKAVESSIEGMQLIRLTIQAINKRMKYLSERLMEIITISHLINEIANRTNILAINASIEAARAGEQGKGFVIISDEIRNLAEKASKSTKQIADIINAVQTESAVVTKHLEEETKYVEMESKTAEETESAFKEIEKTITDMTGIISEINLSAEGQKEVTTEVALSMADVRAISVEVLKRVQELAEISKSLTNTSDMLVSSVARFRLQREEAEEPAQIEN
jgi:twitching motility protein PilJ